jgi:hypothetical protein
LIRKTASTGTNVLSNGVNFNNSGTLELQSGTLNFSGNYDLSKGTITILIASLSDSGHLAINGSATFGGAFDLNFVNGYRPNEGDSFTIASYGSHTGAFSTMNGLALGGLTLTPNYRPTSLILTANVDNHALLTSATKMANGTFQFQVLGAVGRSCVIEASADLANWVPIFTNITGGQFLFNDLTITNAPERFYRAVSNQ